MNEKGERLCVERGFHDLGLIRLKCRKLGSGVYKSVRKKQSHVTSDGQSYSHTVSHSVRPDIPVLVHYMSVGSGAQSLTGVQSVLCPKPPSCLWYIIMIVGCATIFMRIRRSRHE